MVQIILDFSPNNVRRSIKHKLTEYEEIKRQIRQLAREVEQENININEDSETMSLFSRIP